MDGHIEVKLLAPARMTARRKEERARMEARVWILGSRYIDPLLRFRMYLQDQNKIG
jgi:hypothetical protein